MHGGEDIDEFTWNGLDSEGEDQNEEKGGESACGDHGARCEILYVLVLVRRLYEKEVNLRSCEKKRRECEICLNESEGALYINARSF